MRMGVRAAGQRLSRIPAWIYQRQQALWDRAVLAGGWMCLYWVCSGVESWLRLSAQGDVGGTVALLPAQWRLVMAALIFVLGLWRPVAGYAAFIVAVAYPLYLVSIYVMALALAVLVLLAPVMAVYAERGVLFLAVLVLMTVLVAPLHLAPLVPLLVGLWWQGAGSWIGGGAAALWLKLCAGMSGYSIDLWSLYGWTMKAEPVYERFHRANSLQTVALILEPFGFRLASVVRGAGLSTELVYPVSAGLYVLFNFLEICVWAAAAFVVSAVLDGLAVRWAGQGRAGQRTVLGLLPGLLLLWAGFVVLPAWLGLAGPGWLDPPWLVIQVVWLGLVAWALDAFLRYLHRPVSLKVSAGEVRPRERASESGRRAGKRAGEGEYEQGELVSRDVRRPLGQMERWRVRAERTKTREPSSDQASDIMIELD
jgi:hypothetical protein